MRHLGIVGDAQTSARGVVGVAVGADRVLVDERRLRLEVVERGDVGGGDARRIPDLANQPGPRVHVGEEAEQPLFLEPLELGARQRLDRGVEISERVAHASGRKIGSTQPRSIGVHSTVTGMPIVTASASTPVRLVTSRAPGAPSRSTTAGT